MQADRMIATLVIFLLLLMNSCTQQFSPKKAPLMTRWSKDIDRQNILPEYPRPQLKREQWLNLNGIWEFQTAQEGESLPEGQLKRQILVPFAIESALSGVMEKTKHAWYRKTFTVPKNWKDQRIMLNFGAVDWQAIVYVNGSKAGEHRGGFDHFCFDITNYLKESGTQELLVFVFDPTDEGVYPRGKQVDEPGGIFYTSVTGIWQTVWLEPVQSSHITRLHLQPDIGKRTLELTVHGTAAALHEVRVRALDGDAVLGSAKGRLGEPMILSVPQAKLWRPEAPHLYDLDIRLIEQETVLDQVESYFGMREISLKKDKQGILSIALNDEIFFQIGLLDQGYWPDGLYTAPSDEALCYDIEIAKKLGFNVLRKHAKREPDRWYYWCDKLGMLVWQDMPGVNPKDFAERRNTQTDLQFETELRKMINELQSFPSIMMWVIFNEGWGQFDTERFTAMTAQMDRTRLINNASGWTDKGVGDIIDMHKYPGPGAPAPEETRAAVLGEFGGLGLPIPNHTWTEKAWGYRNLKSRGELLERYTRLYDEVWALKATAGLSAVIYTQITDVETETNGLLTYDREVVKLDTSEARIIHRDELVSFTHIRGDDHLFLDELEVKLGNRKGETIRYTLDGSPPDEQSTKYTAPIRITETATLKARSFAEDGRTSPVVRRKFTKTELQEAITPESAPRAGIKYRYFAGNWNRMPNFDTLNVAAEGVQNTINLENRVRDDFFGFEFTGLFKANRAGVYTFYTESDDGSHLYLGEQQIVDNAGIHGMVEKHGQIALKKGYHPIRVTFFQGGGGRGLIVRIKEPGLKKQELEASMLFH